MRRRPSSIPTYSSTPSTLPTGPDKVPQSPNRALAKLDDFSAWPVITTDQTLVREAVLLSRDAVLSFWDSLVVVAAARSGARTLYTEDLNNGQIVHGVQVVNPFSAV